MTKSVPGIMIGVSVWNDLENVGESGEGNGNEQGYIDDNTRKPGKTNLE